MSKETSKLSNHTLNTASIDALAMDLSQRLQANISYGYANDFDFELLKQNKEPSYKRIELERITSPHFTKTLFLDEEDYCYRNFINKHGKETLNHPVFNEESHYKDAILKAQKTMCYELYDNEIDRNSIVDIYKHCFLDWFLFDIGWWDFGSHFSFEDDYKDNLKERRIETRNWIQKFGGTEVLIGCIETKSNFIFEMGEEKQTWETIKQKAKTTFGELFLNIPDYVLNDENKDKPECLQTYFGENNRFEYYSTKPGKTGIDFKKQNETIYYEIYFDDFKDL